MPPAASHRRTAFVTGGTGFVGTNLVDALVAAGWDVTALHRPGSRVRHLERLGVRLVAGDVTDLESLRRAVPEGVDTVFHVAASLTFWAPLHRAQDRVNVGGTANVVAAARERRANRLVHTSSIAAFGEHDDAVTEDTPSTAERGPVNYYRTKWRAEVEVRRGIDAGLDAVIVNPANIVGPHDRTGWSRLFFLVRDGKIPALPPGRASWCHVREVVRAHVAAAERGRRGANYLLGGADATDADVIRIVAELLGRRAPRWVVPAPALLAFATLAALPSYVTRREPPITPESARIMAVNALCRSDRAERELGYRPAALREMFADAHAWLVAEGLLPARPGTPESPTARP